MQFPRLSIHDGEKIKRSFDESGFVILHDAFAGGQVAEVNNEIAHIIAAYLAKAGLPACSGDEIFTRGLLALEDKDHEYVAAVYDTIFQTPAFMRLISSREIEKQIRNLLNIDDTHSLYGFTNRCLLAPPGDERRTYGWHQETFYTVPHGSYIQTWAPLVADTTTATGTVEVCVGSHKEGIAPQQWNETPGRVVQIIVDQRISDKYPQAAIEMKLGELLLFSGHLIHRSGANTSSRVRYSLVGMYHDVSHSPFMTPKIGFTYRGTSPRDFYDEKFGKNYSSKAGTA
jgi:hypothetical protein